jgi:hypothetical protein
MKNQKNTAMKKSILLSALIILLSAGSYSQESDSTKKPVDTSKNSDEFKTLFGNYHSSGFYGAFSIGYTQIDNQQAVIFGGRFEWIVGHSLGFGFGGNGFINEYHFDSNLGRDVFLTGGYGGLYIEPILAPKFPVHISFPIMLGAGGISYVTKDMNSYQNMVEDSEIFLIAEPAAEIEVNVTRHFRVAFGASYKFTTPFNVGTTATSTVSPDALETWSYLITFKFGRF